MSRYRRQLHRRHRRPVTITLEGWQLEALHANGVAEGPDGHGVTVVLPADRSAPILATGPRNKMDAIVRYLGRLR